MTLNIADIPACDHDWHKVWLRKNYQVCYKCQAVREISTGKIIISHEQALKNIAEAKRRGLIK